MIRVRVARLENGQYLVTADDVPGLVAQGRTKSEAVSIAERGSGWQNPTFHVCTDPSHPTLVQFPQQQKTVYRQVVDKIRANTGSVAPDTGVVASVSGEVSELLSHPSDGVSERFRLQQMRQRIAKEWGTVFCKLDNLAHLADWFMLDCIREKDNGDALRLVLCLLVLESTRSIFATVQPVTRSTRRRDVRLLAHAVRKLREEPISSAVHERGSGSSRTILLVHELLVS